MLVLVCIYYLYYYNYIHTYYIPRRVVKPHLWKLEKEGHGACLRKCTHHPTLLLHLYMLAWRSQYYQEDPVPSSNGNHHHSFVCSICITVGKIGYTY